MKRNDLVSAVRMCLSAAVLLVSSAPGAEASGLQDQDPAPAKMTIPDRTGNPIRLGESEEEIRSAVWRLVYGEDPGLDPVEDLSWPEAVLAHGWVQTSPPRVVMLPDEGTEALAWALPGAYWAVATGCPIVFSGRNRLNAESADCIREYRLPVTVAAPVGLISNQVLVQVKALAPVHRLAGENPAAHAAIIAEQRAAGNAGFRRKARAGEEQKEELGCVLAGVRHDRQALAALPLAHFYNALLLYAGAPETRRFLQQYRRSEKNGIIKRLWVAGDGKQTASRRPQRAETGAGMPAKRISGLEKTGVSVLVICALVCGVWVFGHAWLAEPKTAWSVRLAWGATSLLMPGIGACLYFQVRRRRRRPLEISAVLRSAEAVAMTFGLGVPALTACLFGFFRTGWARYFRAGADGPEWLLGAGAFLLLLALTAGVVGIVWAAVQMPLQSKLDPEAAWPELAVRTMAMTLISVAAWGLGMLATAWGLRWIPVLPGSPDWTLPGLVSVWLATGIGFLLAWIANIPLARPQTKKKRLSRFVETASSL